MKNIVFNIYWKSTTFNVVVVHANLVLFCQEKQVIEKRLDENDKYIRSLQDKIKALINEKDSLTGRNKSLQQEKELLQVHCHTSLIYI